MNVRKREMEICLLIIQFIILFCRSDFLRLAPQRTNDTIDLIGGFFYVELLWKI